MTLEPVPNATSWCKYQASQAIWKPIPFKLGTDWEAPLGGVDGKNKEFLCEAGSSVILLFEKPNPYSAKISGLDRNNGRSVNSCLHRHRQLQPDRFHYVNEHRGEAEKQWSLALSSTLNTRYAASRSNSRESEVRATGNTENQERSPWFCMRNGNTQLP